MQLTVRREKKKKITPPYVTINEIYDNLILQIDKSFSDLKRNRCEYN